MNVLSLFDGISCGQIALERANLKVDKYYASEIDVNSINVTKHHYPNTIHIGNVNDVDFSIYKNIFILFGGSPCQDLSRSNLNNKGLDGERSKLFFKFIEALKIIKPKYYVFENVGSMYNDNMEIISKYFGHKPICINSNLISGQSRKRYYWTNIPNVTQPINKNILVKDILENDVREQYYVRKDYLYIPKDTKHNSKNGLQFVAGIIINNKWIKNEKNNSGNFSQGNRVYSINGKSCTINSCGNSGLYYLEDGNEFSKNNIRRLTPLEIERLQTIPDNYTNMLNETNRYKSIGNAWTVDIITHILSFIPGIIKT